jgi:hypothetical protein
MGLKIIYKLQNNLRKLIRSLTEQKQGFVGCPTYAPHLVRAQLACCAMVVCWTGRPVRTRDVKSKHISSLLHQPVRQPTDAVAVMRGTDWGRRQSRRGDPLGGFAVYFKNYSCSSRINA